MPSTDQNRTRPKPVTGDDFAESGVTSTDWCLAIISRQLDYLIWLLEDTETTTETTTEISFDADLPHLHLLIPDTRLAHAGGTTGLCACGASYTRTLGHPGTWTSPIGQPE